MQNNENGCSGMACTGCVNMRKNILECFKISVIGGRKLSSVAPVSGAQAMILTGDKQLLRPYSCTPAF